MPMRTAPPDAPTMTSRPLIALLAAACALAAAVGASAASSQPSEQIQLVPADVAMAKRIVLQKADVGPGWTRKASTAAESSAGISASSSSPEAGCETGVDLSQFTITGESVVSYETKGAAVSGSVAIFPTAAQAAGDLAASMSPAARTCMAQEVAKAFSAVAKEGGRGTVRYQVGATKVFTSSSYRALRAEHVWAYAISGHMVGPGGTVPISVSIMAVTKGRVAAALFATSLTPHALPVASLARRMLGRFPGHWEIAE
jgi:hypothetical protein